MITIQKVTSNVQSVPASLQTFIDTSNCVLEDRVQYSTVHNNCTNLFKILHFCVFLYCNRHVHRDVLITLYIPLPLKRLKKAGKDVSILMGDRGSKCGHVIVAITFKLALVPQQHPD